MDFAQEITCNRLRIRNSMYCTSSCITARD